MAEWTGILTPPIFVEDTLRCSAIIIDNTVVSPVEVGVLESVIPIDASSRNADEAITSPRSRTGVKVDSFLDDFYYRIHVIETSMPFGAVLSEIIDTFIVWNSFFVSKTCVSITKTNPDEFGLAGESAPFALKALELTTYTVTIYKEGSADFTSTITFDFTAAGTRIVTLTGVRMLVFPFPPEFGIKESLECLTDILTPNDGVGSEQRISIRPMPRQSFTYPLHLEDEREQSRFEAIMFSWHKRSFGLPLWTEKELHTTAIDALDETITVDTTNADYRAGGYAVIWKSLTSYEAVKIDAVADNLLTLNSPVVGSYTGNKFIMPCRTAQIVNVVKRTNTEKEFSRMQITFAVKDNILLTGFVAVQSYLGLPVILTGSYIGQQSKDYTSDSDSFVQDYGLGDFDYFSDSEFNFLSQNWTFYNDTKAKCWDFRLFIHSLLGRQGTFWTPTYREDLIATEIIHAVDTSFRIENIKLAENMTFNTLRNHLAFVFPSGTIICKAITGIVEVDADEEIISIDTALGVEVAIGGCKISFLDLSRQASDLIDFDWGEANKNIANQVLMMVKE